MVCMFIAALCSIEDQYIPTTGFIQAFLLLRAFTMQDASQMQITFCVRKGVGKLFLLYANVCLLNSPVFL